MFYHVYPEKPHKCVLKPSEQYSFFQDDRFEGHMPGFTLKMNVFPSISWETHKCVLKPSEQCLFSKMIYLRGHMPRFYYKNEHFPINILRNPINVYWNPQNSACFSKMIDLRGHMPRFTLKMNIFPSISWETP